MRLPIAFRPEVRDEVDAYLWYERQREGLGEEFLGAVRDILAEVGDSPGLGPTLYRDVRVRLLGRFPYAVYYRVEPGRVLIVAIQHGRRDPRRWRARL